MTESENTHRAFGRRRRRNHPGGRDARIVVKVSPAEDVELRNRAEDAGMTVQRLLVTGALSPAGGVPVNHAEKVAAWKEATDIRNLLSGIAVNMNQIARHANSEREVPADFEAAVDAAHRASARVRDAFGEVFAVSFPATKKADTDGERGASSGPITAAEGEGWSV
ncbi:plasmid mobilization relaxosome protein MobC [Gordonia sp. IITR100]|uniref:plasmid mobilization protein n=1 Tax=Gordonia sp. IITR100 TaxID=1314686 RepID=UPI0009910C83|nr:plasmid mobilization relaxosome protein MobC [Gordonia sp. IITR100]